MDDSNKFNLLYFEDQSMRRLFQSMDQWQHEHKRRLLSTSIEKDGDLFCCIALGNPTEVVIVSGRGLQQATVSHSKLNVSG